MSAAREEPNRVILDGKYALCRELGAGASGTVYEAEHLLVGKYVAIKVMNAGAFAEPGARDAFSVEARAAARIGHANVVDIHDLGVTPEGMPYLVMELLHGETLADIIEARGALPYGYACELMLQVLAGLSAAHAHDILHCDLKPANVMVTHPRPDRPLVKVLDFGIARRMTGADGSKAKGSGGTPMYIAPEQAQGNDVDARSDVYSAAAMLYTMLAGRDPFEGETALEVVSRAVSGQFVPLARANPSVPKLLAAVVESGLKADPRLRLQSAEEFAEHLRPFAGQNALSFSLGPARRLLSDPIPLVAGNRDRDLALLGTLAPVRALHAVRIDESSTPAPGSAGQRSPTSAPRESSVIPIQPNFARVSESLLVAPRIPRSASTPRLEAGTDFMPLQGDPDYDDSLTARRSATVAPIRRIGSNAWPALIATGIGFGLGVVIAWASGMFG
jgi:serine/threonine-protein kinase